MMAIQPPTPQDILPPRSLARVIRIGLNEVLPLHWTQRRAIISYTRVH